jgi:hypothetical protein
MSILDKIMIINDLTLFPRGKDQKTNPQTGRSQFSPNIQTATFSIYKCFTRLINAKYYNYGILSV